MRDRAVVATLLAAPACASVTPSPDALFVGVATVAAVIVAALFDWLGYRRIDAKMNRFEKIIQNGRALRETLASRREHRP